MKSTAIVAVTVAAAAGLASAQTFLSYTTSGSVYTNTFDSPILASTGNPTWTNNSPFQTITGWSAYRSGSAGVSGLRDDTSTNVSAYSANDGASNTGSLYSYGSSGTSERALGTLASAAGDFLMMFAVRNDTGLTLDSFTFNYDFEQWRNGGNTSAHSLVVDYKVKTNASFSSGLNFENQASFTTGYTAPGAAWNGTSVVNTATAGAVDGNAAGLVANRGGTITGITWNPGTLLIIRFWDDNNSGNDHGLAIDNVRFSAVPTPGAAALLGLGALAVGRRRR
jgi:hypothetical protein